MSVQQSAVDPSRVESAMTNHISHPADSEHVNGGVITKPSIAQLVRQDSSDATDAKPKSTFKITSVTLHPQKGSSQDGRHSFGEGEDDEESAVEDSLVQTDVEESPVPPNHLADVVKQGSQRQDRVDSTSRFKVVKIQKREPYTVGRWRISDFMSESEVSSNKIVGEVNPGKRSDSGNSSRASSTHYVHGVDDPAKNPLASINASSNPPLASIQQSPLNPSALATTVESAADTHLNLAKPEPTGDSNAIRVDADSVQQNSASKDPHLIGQHSVLPANQPTNVGDIARAAAVSAATSAAAVPSQAQLVGNSSNQHHVISREQTTPAVSAQANTQVTLQQSAVSAPNVAQAASAVTAPLSAAVAASSDSQSSSADPDHQAAIEEAPSAAIAQPKPQSSSIVENLEISGGVEALAANLTELVDPSAADGDKAEDADATATGVAIDNKIEQAMDLVKSHLMLAVREEVEELKQQIKQLIERNSQLEQENKLLRSSAAPETMAQLALLNRQQNH